ncbi:hypothetical protein NX059_008950 [Plenodomus lindquistii]|nr:hypothetical protein NX059_008950 [Plenodomus lindquistii]
MASGDASSTGSTTPKKRPSPHEIYSGAMITVLVGSDSKAYQINKALAMHYSGFFEGAFSSGKFKESKTGVVTLKYVETHTFDAFADWLYTEKLPDNSTLRVRYPSTIDLLKDWFWLHLIVFADRFLVPKLRLPLVERLIEYYSVLGAQSTRFYYQGILPFSISARIPWYEGVVFAFNHLPSDHPVLRLVVDFHCRYWEAGDKEEAIQALPTMFLSRVINQLAPRARSGKAYEPLVLADYQESELKADANDDAVMVNKKRRTAS